MIRKRVARKRRLQVDDLPAELDDIGGTAHYDRLGQPIGMRRWLVLQGDHNYARVARTAVGEHEVSTVWIGLPQTRLAMPELLRILTEGPRAEDDLSDEPELPLIFETLVFPGTDICARTATEAEALQAHADAVSMMRTQLDVFDA